MEETVSPSSTLNLYIETAREELKGLLVELCGVAGLS